MFSENSLRLVLNFIGIGNLGNAANGDLSGESVVVTKSAIAQLVKIELSVRLVLERLFRQPVTSFIATAKRILQECRLLFRRQQFYVCNQFHSSYIEDFMLEVNRLKTVVSNQRMRQ